MLAKFLPFLKPAKTLEETHIRVRHKSGKVTGRSYRDDPERARVVATRLKQRYGEDYVTVTTRSSKVKK